MIDKYKLLYAEDEELIRNNMSNAFEFMFESVFIAKDGQEAIELYKKESPDIVILDIEMPYLNGLDVAQEIRKTNKNIPIVIATAYTDTKYFLQAVELNLTTYILKPITLDDLQKAIKKCQIQLQFSKNDKIYINSDVVYDIDARTLYVNETITFLTNIEMRFLEYMLKQANRIVSYEELERNIWTDHGMSGSAIRSLVRDLRKRIGKNSIENIAKVGYKLVTCQ